MSFLVQACAACPALRRVGLVASAVFLLAAPAGAQLVPGPPPSDQFPNFDDAEDNEIRVPAQRSVSAALSRISTTVRERNEERLTEEAEGLRLFDDDLDDGLDDEDEEREDNEEAEEDARAPFLRRRLAREGEESSYFAGGTPAVWATGTFTTLDDSGARRDFDGELYTPFVGADYAFGEGWVVGVSVGYERSDLDTDFNDGRLESDGVILLPYVGKAIGRHVVVEAGAGYGWLSYDRTRGDGAFRGSFDAERFTSFANVSGFMPETWHGVDRLTLSARLGFQYSNEQQDGFVEEGSNDRIPSGEVELGQVIMAGEARYAPEVSAIPGVEVFARAEGRVDAISTDRRDVPDAPAPVEDITDVRVGLGAVARITDRLSAHVSVDTVLSRKDFTEHSAAIGLRLSF